MNHPSGANWQSVDGEYRWPLSDKRYWSVVPRLAGNPLSLRTGDGETLAEPFFPGNVASDAGWTCETYLRPESVILRLPETGDFPLELLMQFRPMAAAEGVDTIELILSMQTSLLDAAPLEQLRSILPPGEPVDLPSPPKPVGRGIAPAFAGAMPAVNFCAIRSSENASRGLFFFAGHPGDVAWLAISRLAMNSLVESRLRTSRMEKGVIRRLRFLFGVAWGTPRSGGDQIEDVVRAIARFEQSSLPLVA